MAGQMSCKSYYHEYVELVQGRISIIVTRPYELAQQLVLIGLCCPQARSDLRTTFV